jgi:hypothetical protein
MQSACDHIASRDSTYSFWCASQNNVPLLQCHHPANILYLPWYTKKHELSVVVLPDLAVDGEGEHDVVGIWHRGFRNEVADRAERIEAFRYGPWKAFLLCFVLNVSRCEVDRYDVA